MSTVLKVSLSLSLSLSVYNENPVFFLICMSYILPMCPPMISYGIYLKLKNFKIRSFVSFHHVTRFIFSACIALDSSVLKCSYIFLGILPVLSVQPPNCVRSHEVSLKQRLSLAFILTQEELIRDFM
jgi:hypothetical protein